MKRTGSGAEYANSGYTSTKDEEHGEPDKKLATRRNLPKRGQPMPLLEQDLVRDTIGEADQKHMGVSYSANDALLRIRQGTAWLHAHCGKNADAPTTFKELDNQERINLNRVWGKIDEATRALDSETKQADESLGEPPTHLGYPQRDH